MIDSQMRAKPCIGPRPENTGELVDGVYRCIASDCLGWRPIYSMELVNLQTKERRPSIEGSHYDPRVEGLDGKIVGGYCGLAGKP
jgi:chaperone required for assembly of F1-ATPase